MKNKTRIKNKRKITITKINLIILKDRNNSLN